MKKSNRLGYTLIELLGVIVILGILATIAVGSYMNHIHRSRMIAYESAEVSMKGAVESMFIECSISSKSSHLCTTYKLPDAGKSVSVSLSDLIQGDYMENISDPGAQGKACSPSRSYVLVTRGTNAEGNNVDVDYKSCLYCEEYQTEGCSF